MARKACLECGREYDWTIVETCPSCATPRGQGQGRLGRPGSKVTPTTDDAPPWKKAALTVRSLGGAVVIVAWVNLVGGALASVLLLVTASDAPSDARQLYWMLSVVVLMVTVVQSLLLGLLGRYASMKAQLALANK